MIEFEFEKGLLTASGTGRVTAEDVRAAARRASVHPFYTSTASLLLNLREVSLVELSREEVTSLIEQYSLTVAHEPIHRVAIVANDDYNFGIGRMVQFLGLSAHGEYQAFRDYYLARAWAIETSSDFVSMRDGSPRQR